jgi:hypothetical protein
VISPEPRFPLRVDPYDAGSHGIATLHFYRMALTVCEANGLDEVVAS